MRSNTPSLLALPLTLAIAGCGAGVDEVDQRASEVSVSTLRGRPGCTTAGAEGLSAQLLDELLCLSGGRLVSFAPSPNITLTHPRVHPVLSPSARDGILRAAARVPLRINSGFRTLVEQWLLWTAAGCGLVATPGNSNHETGRAVDVDNWSAARPSLVANGFAHSYPTDDPVHFDGPGDDFRALSVRAFQRLWNANNPADRIAEDGVWGPMTQARLERSPAEGFRIGRVCAAPPMATEPRLRAQFVSQSFATAATAIELSPGQELPGFFELRNTGTETWMPGLTFLGTTVPRDRMSALAHPTWTTATRPATIDRPVPTGATGRFNLTLRAPSAAGEYSEFFGLIHGGVGWFSDPGQGGPPDNQLQVRVRVTGGAFGARVVSNSCAEDAVLAPDETRRCTVVLRNIGARPWTTDRTMLGTVEPRDHESALADLSWLSPARIDTVSAAVAPGSEFTFSFLVRAPAEGGSYREHFNLFDEDGGWFSDMGNLGPTDTDIAVRITVPGGASPDAGDEADASDPGSPPEDGAAPRPDASRPPSPPRMDAMPIRGGCGCTVPARRAPMTPRSMILGILAGAAALSRRRSTDTGAPSRRP
jgi:hypothetical protein